MKRVLLTAFEPFGEDTENAAALVCGRIAPEGEGYRVEKRILPTEFKAGAQALLRAMDEVRPNLTLCLGQAAGRTRVTPERVAVNLMDARIPDNGGWQPDEEAVVPGGPPAYFTNVPAKAAVCAAKAAGYPAVISDSAGTFVCNCIFYTLMHRIAATPAHETTPLAWGDFIHVPYVLEQKNVPEGRAALPLKEVAGTVQFLLEEIVRQMDGQTVRESLSANGE